ncbi:MAG: hypothetical protein JOY54_20775 [Acidobacteriaceae bacterium]|nr:hypothetical protein [Acidobacteriaceae bacterium]
MQERLDITPPTISRWKSRFVKHRVAGLLETGIPARVLAAQCLARRTQHLLRVVPVDGQPRSSAAEARALRYITQSATFCAR